MKEIFPPKNRITMLVAFKCPNFRVLETPKNIWFLLPTVPDYIFKGKKEKDMIYWKNRCGIRTYSVELTFPVNQDITEYTSF
ncbi:MAG TPA: hypothetical protein GX009_11825 [Candidatus Atribacteria bacterium]|mgnify:CR=1 FL=1|jgi:hypothetical protein|nr:hypothetical protein [Candidatus Atribacteria bacterium]